MRLNCNLSALISNNQLNKTQTNLDKSIERLSSGLRINHAEDDAAGMAIAKRMHTQIKALERAGKNAADGVSVVQTAEAALGEVENMLQRARELAVQAADESYTDDDRAAIQQEIGQILKEVDRVSTDTEYNTMPLLDGTLERRSYSDVDDVTAMDVSTAVKAGEYKLDVTAAAEKAAFSFTLPASFGGESCKININGAEIDLNSGDTADDLYARILDGCERAGVDVMKTGDQVSLKSREYGSNASVSVDFKSDETAALFGAARINTTYGRDCEVTLGAGFGATAITGTDGNLISVRDVNGFDMKIEIPGETTFTDCTMKVTDIGTLGIQVGANEGQQLIINIPKTNTHTLGIDNVNVNTSRGASEAISSLDKAISEISSIRSKLGAYQNRLESSEDSVDSYSENMTAALSRIEDCDMAEEMTEYTSQSVLSQAATSVLAQANERPETVLQLLQ